MQLCVEALGMDAGCMCERHKAWMQAVCVRGIRHGCSCVRGIRHGCRL